MKISANNIDNMEYPICNFNGFLRITYDRTINCIVLLPCCSITLKPEIDYPPFVYECNYFINHFEEAIKEWCNFDMCNLEDYYLHDSCVIATHSNNINKGLCKNYKYNRKLHMIENCVSRNCNYHCIMCHERKNLLDYEQELYIKINELLMNYVHDNMSISTTCFGEPFLYKGQIYEMIESRKKYKNSHVSILSNGSLLNDDDIEYFDKNRQYCNISLSIDALDKDIYEAIRIGGNFDKVYNNMIKLNDRKLLHSVIYVVQKLNKHIAMSDYNILKNQLKVPIVEMVLDGFDKENNYSVIKDIIEECNMHLINKSYL